MKPLLGNTATVTINVGKAKITSIEDIFEPPVDQTEQTRDTIVGKQESVSVTITGNPNVNFNVNWTVNGDVMKSYDFQTGKRTNLTQAELAQPNISWAWVSDSGRRTVSATVSIGGNSVTLNTYFNVIRPTINVATTMRPVSFRNDLTGGNLVGGFIVGLGSFNQDAERTAHGIELTANNPSVPGIVKWLQFLENGYEKKTFNNSDTVTCVSHYLDRPSGNSSPEYPSVNGTMTDSPRRTEPGGPGMITYERVDTFSSYVMFKANIADYYVPLKVVEWDWSAKVSRPNFNEAWMLDTSSQNIGEVEDATSYPAEWAHRTGDLQ